MIQYSQPSQRHIIISITLFVMLAVFVSPSFAQSTKLPELNVPGVEDQSAKDEDFNPSEVPNIQLRNTYLYDVVKLQYQISLLKDLLERQKKIFEIEETYKKLGVNFKRPAPPFDLCRLVPVNIPCFDAYPYLYPKIQELEEKEKAKREAQAAAIRQANTAASRPTLPRKQTTSKKKSKPKKTKITSDYKWADVFCIGGECKAILVEAGNSNTRQTVLEGDELLDGSVVDSIKSGEVIVVKRGKELRLDPAPAVSDGGPVSPLSVLYGASETVSSTPATPATESTRGNSALESELFEAFAGDADTEVSDEDETAELEENVAPEDGSLGPTGLF